MAKSLIGKAIAAIVALFASNWETFAAKAWNKVPKELQEKFNVGVEVVELLKKFIESPAADIVTALIPGHYDDDVKNWLRHYLPLILADYKDITNSDKLGSKSAHNIATDINFALTDLPYGQVALTTEVAYQNS